MRDLCNTDKPLFAVLTKFDLQCLPEHLMARVQPAHRYHRGFYDRIVLRHAQNGGRSGRWSDPDVF